MATTVLHEILDANAKFQTTFTDGDKTIPPARRFAVLTCMDARIDPAQLAGLAIGDAHVIRNAGGRASDDAIRSLVISYKLLGTQEFFVIHHTDCGMQYFNDGEMAGLLGQSLETAAIVDGKFKDVGTTPGSVQGNYVQWLSFPDLDQSVRDDVTRIRTHALVPSSIAVRGFVYDVQTGALREVTVD